MMFFSDQIIYTCVWIIYLCVCVLKHTTSFFSTIFILFLPFMPPLSPSTSLSLSLLISAFITVPIILLHPTSLPGHPSSKCHCFCQLAYSDQATPHCTEHNKINPSAAGQPPFHGAAQWVFFFFEKLTIAVQCKIVCYANHTMNTSNSVRVHQTYPNLWPID